MVVILDVRPPSRGQPPGALDVTSGKCRVLDWIRHAFDAVPGAELYQTAGGVGSLRELPLRADRECYLTRAGVVARGRLVDLLAGARGDVVIAIDRRRRARIDLVKLSARAVACLMTIRDQADGRLATASIPDLVRELLAHGLEVGTVESDGDWAALDTSQDLARFVLGTKAETLERLRPLVRRCTVGAQVRCSVAEWRAAPDEILARVTACFGTRALAVRSSTRSEDGWTMSRAGHFTSVLDVAADRAALSRAIDEVIASYDDDAGDHQVLIQEMLGAVQLSGVVFTRTLIHHMPYYTVNYDDATTRTGCVTSGTGKDLRTLVVHRSVALHRDPDYDPRLVAVLRAARELEELVGHDALDIEFALDAAGVVHLLQLRPIVADPAGTVVADAALDDALAAAGARLDSVQAGGPGLVGQRTYFGVMPDWNPAEIIGNRPRRLALSLYQHLVTDEVWAIQRAECGYRDVRPHPLLVTLAGHPYIDIRVSLNSFIPASLDEGLAERLVDHYLERVRRQPHLHDKLEFDVAFTCLAFDFDRRARAQLRPAGFSAAEIDRLRAGLQGVTRQIMSRYPRDRQIIERLEERHQVVMQQRLDPLDRAHALLEDCRCYGTPPFAHLARGAFVAITLLRSLTAIGILDPEQQAGFLSSLNTVSRGFERDGHRVLAGQLSWADFVARYRHLRPGTYEITSPSYGDDPERYLRPATMGATACDATAAPAGQGGGPAGWSAATRRAIARGLRQLGLPDSVPDFEDFLRATIEAREWSKFVFTRNLSQALDDLASAAAQHGCDRDQMSHLDIQDVFRIRNELPHGEIARWIREEADRRQREHHVTLGAQLPSLVFERRHLYAFEHFSSQPNFVTSKRVVAPLIELPQAQQVHGKNLDLSGRLVLVPQADPGYDWLFGHRLVGLITMFGGANSHLAIRAAEVNLPAAIGVGETLYERLAHAHVLDMDCAGQQIRMIQ
jgi:glutamine kinase